MAKAKKQKKKSLSHIEKIWFDEEHSLPDNDLDSRKARKKSNKKQRHQNEKYYFSQDLKNKARYSKSRSKK